MCGVVGGWSGRSQPVFSSARIGAGLDAIRHRGPDDTGVAEWQVPSGAGNVVLGSARLAVQDLTSAGHMPMASADGRFQLAYNGEITNYIELRNELVAAGRSFISRTDTEVIVEAWAEWGAASLDRFEGMYAFALLDKRDCTLTLVRDVFGIKPLYYSVDPGRGLTFSSEIPGLIAVSPTRPKLDWQTALDYLQWGEYDTSERTFVDGVTQLMPAHHVTLDLLTGVLGTPQRYWWPAVETVRPANQIDAVDQVREMFLTSVRRNLRSDVPLGVALSGGIDSSAIACSIRHIEPDFPLNTFSFIAPGFAESEHEWVDLVVDATGARPHSIVATGTDLLNDLDSMILAQGEPFRSTSIYAQYRVFQEAREQGVVVTLDGQGGDEVFAGYHGYPAQRLHSLVETGRFREAGTFLDAWGEWPGRSTRAAAMAGAAQFLPSAVARPLGSLLHRKSPLIDFSAVRERSLRSTFPRAEVEGSRSNRVKASLRNALTSHGLPALLRHGDRNAMHFSVESRVPFLDRAMVEFVFGLPEHYLIGADGTSKDILRRAMRGIVPDAILDRRDKVGFSTPETSWLTELGRASAGRTSAEAPEIGLLRSGVRLAEMTEAELKLGSGAHWRLLNLRRWIQLLDIDAT